MKKNSNNRPATLHLAMVATAILTMLLAASAAHVHGLGSVFHFASARFTNEHSMLTLKIDCAIRLSGGERSECKVGVLESHDNEIEIKLVSTNPGLLKLERSEVKLLPNQSVAIVAITTSPTPIKTSVVINAHVNTNNLVHAAAAVEVVPALIASAQLSTGSFIGTHGAKTTCRVKLKAPAPPGGIQLYLSPLKVAPTPSNREPITFQVPTPTVSAGSSNVDIDLPYDLLRQGNHQISQFDSSIVGFTNEFDAQPRTIELIVALEPQGQGTKQQWVAIPGIANKLSFEIVPLRITSLSVQPSTLSGGEALASFTLSAPPGSSEFVLLRPVKTGSSAKLWATPLGVSCAATPTNVSGNSNQLQLVQGTSTYQFKVCSGTVSTSFTSQVTVYIRGSDAETPVTVQP